MFQSTLGEITVFLSAWLNSQNNLFLWSSNLKIENLNLKIWKPKSRKIFNKPEKNFNFSFQNYLLKFEKFLLQKFHEFEKFLRKILKNWKFFFCSANGKVENFNNWNGRAASVKHLNWFFENYVHVQLQVSISASVTCEFDFTNFPYDSQICKIPMGSWFYAVNEFRLRNYSTGYSADFFNWPNRTQVFKFLTLLKYTLFKYLSYLLA